MKSYINILKKKAIWLFPIIFLYISYALLFHFIFTKYSPCPLKTLFGIPCPGCGLTRSYISFFKGNFKDAFYYHPLFFLIPILLFIAVFNEIPWINRIYRLKLFWAAMFFTFLICYIIRMILYYPGEPMSYDKGLFFKFIEKIF